MYIVQLNDLIRPFAVEEADDLGLTRVITDIGSTTNVSLRTDKTQKPIAVVCKVDGPVTKNSSGDESVDLQDKMMSVVFGEKSMSVRFIPTDEGCAEIADIVRPDRSATVTKSASGTVVAIVGKISIVWCKCVQTIDQQNINNEVRALRIRNPFIHSQVANRSDPNASTDAALPTRAPPVRSVPARPAPTHFALARPAPARPAPVHTTAH